MWIDVLLFVMAVACMATVAILLDNAYEMFRVRRLIRELERRQMDARTKLFRNGAAR
jgi:biopolymer transport protein ExbB/TolQ